MFNVGTLALLAAVTYSSPPGEAMHFVDTHTCRSDEEINAAFYSHKAEFTEAGIGHSREPRHGVVIESFKIASDGQIHDVQIVSSTLEDDGTAQNFASITSRIQLKASSCSDYFVAHYPIHYQSK